MDTSNLTNDQLTQLCASNSTIDPSCPCLLSGGGPALNTDISGPGVRISFYCQALFLALLTALSKNSDDVANALYTLVLTNVAMVIASFILAFRGDPQMSLHDAIVVIYLLIISWTSTFFSIPTGILYKKVKTSFGCIYVVQSYFIFAFIFAVVITAKAFGSSNRCNSHAVIVIFGAFRALNAGRIAAFITTSIVTFIYTVLTIMDYGLWKPSRYVAFGKKFKEMTERSNVNAPVETIETEGVRRDREANTNRMAPDLEHDSLGHGPNMGNVFFGEDTFIRLFVIKGSRIFQLTLITILWSLSIANTELLIKRNRFDGGGDGIGSSLWGFGQILPMFLITLPALNLLKLLGELSDTKGQRRTPIHRFRVNINTFLGGGQPSDTSDHERDGPFGLGAEIPEMPRMHRGPHRSHGPRPFFPFSNMRETHARAHAHAHGVQPSARISDTSIKSELNEDVAGRREENRPTTGMEVGRALHSSLTLSSVDSFKTAPNDNT